MLHVSPEADQSSNYFASFSKKGGKSCQVAEYYGREGQWTASIVAERLLAAFDVKQRSLGNDCQRLKSSWHLVISHEDYVPGVNEDGFVQEVAEDTGIPLYLDPDRPRRFGDKDFREQKWTPHSTPPYSDYVQLCSKGSNFGSTSDKEFVFDHRWQQSYIDGCGFLLERGFLAKDGSPKPEPIAKEDTARWQERQTAREAKAERKIVQADPNSFQELVARDLWDREPYIVNGETGP